MSKQNIALFDLEGVLMDYEGAMRRELAALAALGEAEYAAYGKWQNLGGEVGEHYLGFDIFKSCLDTGFHIQVVAQGAEKRPEASSGKVRWFHEHILPRAPDAAMTVVRDKSTISGDVLVDDYPRSLHRWLEHHPPGLGVMPVKDSNHDFTHAQVVRYDGRNLNAVAERLREAYRR